mgnify:CR=1 FL=1|tara:strand:+ start:1146 stop:1352 length:207 start_codon:yes stop_codon:yes gene_type:complete
MTYEELLCKLRTLSKEELATDVTIYDDNSGRFHQVSNIEITNVDPNFPPLVQLTLFQDHLVQQIVSHD